MSAPCCDTTTCGRKSATSSGTTAWNARNHPASPVPAGSATFTAEPSAPRAPVSSGHPVCGNSVLGCSCSEIVSTRGSSQNAACTPSPWCTSTSTYTTRSAPSSSNRAIASAASLYTQNPDAPAGIAWCNPPEKLTACSASPRHTASAAPTDCPAISADTSCIPANAGSSSVPSPYFASAAAGSADAARTAAM